MPNFAVIENNIVVNVIVADSAEIANQLTGLTCIEYDIDKKNVGRFWEYDGENFINPNPPILPPVAGN